jgi:LuxR family quorum-sensing system transcriptional regulator SinR
LGFLVTESDAYFDIVSMFDDNQPVRPADFFSLLRKHYGVKHTCYIDLFPGSATLHIHRVHHDYTESWVKAYYEQSLYSYDAALHEGMRSVRPIDWRDLRARFPQSEIVFAEAEKHGIPSTGLTFPQVSRGRSVAMLAVSTEVSPKDWPARRKIYMRDIQGLAAMFHASLQKPANQENGMCGDDLPLLTEREAEVLRWSAAGKSYWEIAVILGVSERTVRFFMTNARQKLDVVSNTQAVARAIWNGLIPPP